MPKDPTRHLFLAGLLLTAACRRGPAAAPATTAVLPDRSPAPAATDGEPRTLCLAEPGGAGRDADRDLRAAQDRARRRPMRADEWVAAGSQWVRTARRTADPGFYLNVDGCARVALQNEPAFSPALALRGLALMNDHRFEEARALAASALLRDPENPVALGAWSDALLELGRYDEAGAAAQRLMDVRPGMAAYTRGSYLRWLRGDTGRAKLLVRDALAGRDARDPEPAAWTFVEAAQIFWHEGDYAGADAVYAEALKWVSDYPAALVGRARVAIARGEPRSAVDALVRASRTRPLPETFWLMGDARAMQGDDAGAREAYARVVAEGRRGDRLTLALFYLAKNRDLEEADRLLRAERSGRGGVYMDDALAFLLYRQGRLAEARTASDRALRLGTPDARLLYHAGAIRLAVGDRAAGRSLLQRALRLNPGFDWTGAAEARALLQGETRVASR
jgi:tetratricopeptide (TPR) repeat protein